MLLHQMRATSRPLLVRSSVKPQELSMPYKHTIVGNPDDGFTSAEIEDDDGVYRGRVFELDDGWYFHVDELLS